MAEDVSAQARTGVTIIVLASLVAVVLNLLSIAQTIVSSGMGTLQAGVTSISQQEYALYDQKIKTGVEVKTALSMYTTRDNCVIIRTRNAQKAGKAYLYGSLVNKDNGSGAGTSITASQDPSGNTVFTLADNLFTTNVNQIRNEGEAYYTMEYCTDNYGTIQSNMDIKGITSQGNDQFILESAKFRAELIKNKTGTIVGMVFTQLN